MPAPYTDINAPIVGIYTRKEDAMIKGNYVVAKLGKMRKPQEFVVLAEEGGQMLIQSDKSIGRIYPDGTGRLSTKGSYFYHLSLAEKYTFPKEFVEECRQVCYHKGDTLGGGIVTIG